MKFTRSFAEARMLLAAVLRRRTGLPFAADVDAVLCEDNRTVMLIALWDSDTPVVLCFDLVAPADPTTFDARRYATPLVCGERLQ